jgi:hypothetical protein
MDSSRVFIATLMVTSVICASASVAQDAPPIVGTWKLNREKSQAPPAPAGWFDVRQYSLRPDGYLIGLLVTFNQRGYHYLQFTAKSDGRDYPEYTDDLLADLIATAKPTIRTYSETVVDEYVTAWKDKVNGTVTASGRKIVSKDRQTLTITVDGRLQILVYDRQ